jgi:type III secretion protein J
MFDITVPADQAIEAMAILDKLGLPRPQPTTLLDLFSQTGIVPSERQETIRYQLGLAGQIASTVRSMDGILECQVQLALPENSNTPPRASVFIKHLGVFDDPNSQLGSKIRRLVAGSVPGLEYDNVTLVPDRARFVDVALAPTATQLPEMQKEYAKVFGVVVSTSSVGTLRFIIASLIIIGLVLLAAAIFLGWRLLPGVRKRTEPLEPPGPAIEEPPPPPEPPENPEA